jgi:hypothetical protein
MALGKKTGGRKKGTPNRNTRAIVERLQQEHPNYCPLSELARIANDEATPIELRVQCHKTIAAHTIPKINAITAHEFDVRNGLADDPYSELFVV